MLPVCYLEHLIFCKKPTKTKGGGNAEPDANKNARADAREMGGVVIETKTQVARLIH